MWLYSPNISSFKTKNYGNELVITPACCGFHLAGWLCLVQPKVFGTIWMRSIGIDPNSIKDTNPNMLKLFGFSFLFAFMATIPLSYIVNHDNHTHLVMVLSMAH